MIVTVTPNPSIDRTLCVDRLERGGLHRAATASSEAAGKGLNVSYALHLHGVDTLAVLPLAADSAATYLGLLDGAVPIAPLSVAGAIRVNVSLVEPDGTVTKVNEPGPELDDEDIDALLAAVDSAGATASWLVGCGSLPPGAPHDFYARLARLRSAHRKIAVDTSGEPLRACASEGLDLLKPNVTELEDLAGHPLLTLGNVVVAAGALVAGGVSAVLVSLGADGAVLVDRDGALHAEAMVEGVANTVGAGDALLAGYLAADDGRAGLATAVAWSVAAVRSPATRMRKVTDADVDAVTVHAGIDRDRVLHR